MESLQWCSAPWRIFLNLRILEKHPDFKPKIEQTIGHGLAILRRLAQSFVALHGRKGRSKAPRKEEYGIIGPFLATCVAHLGGALLLLTCVEESERHASHVSSSASSVEDELEKDRLSSLLGPSNGAQYPHGGWCVAAWHASFCI
eukprot:Skav234971  [mRNA]  locus=scaffold122:13699:23119:+ [translate_table: standard]